MSNSQVSRIVENYNLAKNNKQRWQRDLEECYRYFLPQNDPSSTSKPLYDSTGVISLAHLGSNLKHSLFPPWRRWFEIRTPQRADPQINREIERKVSEPLFQALNRSNFDIEISESLLELGIGTGALLLNEGSLNQPLHFSSVPIKELVIEEDAFHEPQSVYRQRELSFKQARQLWPDVNFKTVSGLDLLEATIYNSTHNRYEYSLIDLKTNQLLAKNHLESSPWIIFRWSKHAGQTYGRGPAMQCLPDIKEANKLKELILQNAVLNVIPTYLVANDGVIKPHNLKIKPGSIIPVRNLQGGLPIMPLPRGSDITTGHVLLKEARQIVKETMFYNRLGSINDPVRSATEFVIRNQQLAKDIGASFSRLQRELMEKLIKRSLYILNKKGITQGISWQGEEYTLGFTSPLARLQDQEEINALQQMLALGDKFPEELKLSLKTEEMGTWLANRSGLSAELIRTRAEKKELLNLIQQSQFAQQSPAEQGLQAGQGLQSAQSGPAGQGLQGRQGSQQSEAGPQNISEHQDIWE